MTTAATAFPDGCYPVMLTPFTEDGSAVDYECLEALTEWYIGSGCVGLFPVSQSSEMYDLSHEERLECARVVKRAAKGRAKVVAGGTFADDVADMAKFVNQMAEIVDAVVVLVSKMAKKEESDDVWKANTQKLLELTPGVPLGLYEVPAPYHRLLTPEMLKWLAGTNRFVFHKDTSRRNDLISAKLSALSSLPASCPFKFFNGNCTTLLHSLKEGGKGCGLVSANFYPWFFSWMVQNFQSKPDLAQKVQTFLIVAEGIVKQNYPASAKTYLRHCHGFRISSKCRNGSVFPDIPENFQKLDALHEMMLSVCAEVGIEPCVPTMERPLKKAKTS